jgi:hypothetical protein
MMGELVLNQVEGKVFFTIKMIYFRLYPQYSNIPLFHSDGISELTKSVVSISCKIFEMFD